MPSTFRESLVQNTLGITMTRKSRLSFTVMTVAALIVAATVAFTAVGSAQAATAPTKKAVKVKVKVGTPSTLRGQL